MNPLQLLLVGALAFMALSNYAVTYQMHDGPPPLMDSSTLWAGTGIAAIIASILPWIKTIISGGGMPAWLARILSILGIGPKTVDLVSQFAMLFQILAVQQGKPPASITVSAEWDDGTKFGPITLGKTTPAPTPTPPPVAIVKDPPPAMPPDAPAPKGAV
jgi:hypothetical protein